MICIPRAERVACLGKVNGAPQVVNVKATAPSCYKAARAYNAAHVFTCCACRSICLSTGSFPTHCKRGTGECLSCNETQPASLPGMAKAPLRLVDCSSKTPGFRPSASLSASGREAVLERFQVLGRAAFLEREPREQPSVGAINLPHQHLPPILAVSGFTSVQSPTPTSAAIRWLASQSYLAAGASFTASTSKS